MPPLFPPCSLGGGGGDGARAPGRGDVGAGDCARIPILRPYVMQNGYAALRTGMGTPKLGNGAVSPTGRSSNCPNWPGANVGMLAVDDVTRPDRRKGLSPLGAFSSRRARVSQDHIRGPQRDIEVMISI